MWANSEILSSILEGISSNPNMDIEEVFRAKAKEYGLPEEKIDELTKASGLIDEFARKKEELAQANKEGMTRKGFVYSEISKLVEGKDTSEKEIIISSIQEVAKSSIQETTNLKESKTIINNTDGN